MLRFNKLNGLEFFSLAGLTFSAFGFLALILAFLGFFYAPLLFTGAILALGFLAYLAIISRKNFHFRWEFFFVITLALSAVLLFSHFTTPSIFSGRDQGSLSDAAISLAQNHNFQSSFPAEKEFFKIYGPGEALNFPGFNYDSNGRLETHFPLGYISYLAVFYAFFGLLGLVAANGLSFFLFLISFYLVAKNYLPTPKAFVALFLVLTSFIFSWFFKYTLSENLALGLVWFGILQFILFLKNESKLHLSSFLTAFGLLLFTRIETLALFLVTAAILYLKHRGWKHIARNVLGKYALWLLGGISFLYLISLKLNGAFYVAFAKGLLNSLNFSSNGLSAPVHPFREMLYVFRVFSTYALLPYLILGFLGFIYFLKKKDWPKLIPYFILLPLFVYLLSPSITPDHPWMLRRYLFSVMPVSILYATIFLALLLRKKPFFYTASFFLILTNLIIFIPYLGVQENKNLLPQIKNISSDFETNDLILVDRWATGDPWSMMDGPLNLFYQKQAVYFFNPNDLDKLDLKKFNRTYFIIPDVNIDFYRTSQFFPNLVPIKDYLIENESLNIAVGPKNELYSHSVTLPVYQKNLIYGKIYQLKK
jgi:hypothetical protein